MRCWKFGTACGGRLARGPAVLVEYGASDEAKAEFLLRERQAAGDHFIHAYVPIDVAASALDQMRVRLRESGRICWCASLPADFMHVMALPDGDSATCRGWDSFPDPPSAISIRPRRALLAAGAHGAWT